MRPVPSRQPRVEVLCVGSELLSGKVNTHVSWLSGALRGIGLPIAREATVSDSVDEIHDAVAAALARSDVLLVCGGLGPTFDDVTREGVAEALGRRLRYRPALYAKIRARLYRYYKRRVPPENQRQAFVIEGARVLKNDHGSAPGQLLRVGSKTVILLPGPTWEIQPMFGALLPELRSRYAPRTFSETTLFHLCGITESEADEKLGPLIRRPGPGVELTILAGHGLVDFHVTAAGSSKAHARRRLARARRLVERRVGRHIFGTNEETLESAVGDLLRRRRLRLATAESCTAGLLSGRITRTPGSSHYFVGGIVSYADDVKRAQLGVDPGTILRHGAVSGPCAREMAENVARSLAADCGVSITGIAGPGGGSREKPVGLTYIGIAVRGRPSAVHRHLFAGARDQVRERAVVAALTLLLRRLRFS